jgi:menaquinone-dependent protoporphyrinogen IX oxidase
MKKIAETIAETLRESGIKSELFYVKDAKKLTVKDYNFLILGSFNSIWHNEFYGQIFLAQSQG